MAFMKCALVTVAGWMTRDYQKVREQLVLCRSTTQIIVSISRIRSRSMSFTRTVVTLGMRARCGGRASVQNVRLAGHLRKVGPVIAQLRADVRLDDLSQIGWR
jgi:hypothetical protein